MKENKKVEQVELNELIVPGKEFVTMELGKVDYNSLEKMKDAVAKELTKYEGVELSEEDIVDIKLVSANMNKFMIALKKEIKSKKEEFLTPFEVVEIQKDSILKLIKDSQDKFKDMIDADSLKKKEVLKALLTTAFNNAIEANKDVTFITFNQFMNMNTKLINLDSMSKSKVEVKLKDNVVKFINASIESFASDMKIINLNENGARIKTVYLGNGFQLAEATESVMIALTKETAQQVEINKSMAEKGIDVKVNVETVKEVTETIEVKKEIAKVVIPDGHKKMRFEVEGPKEELQAILTFMKSREVTIRPVKEVK